MSSLFNNILVFCLLLFGFSVQADKEKRKIEPIEIVIQSNDLMQYDKNTISAEKGKAYEIILKNIGKLPKAAMGHNLIILKSGIDALTFGQELITKHGATLQNEWKPVKGSRHILAQTKMLGPSEQDTLKIKFDKSGAYHYLCSFPGHFGQMRGIINVK
jgi:azurin